MNENQKKAIEWIDEQLAKPDFSFKISASAILSVHHFLQVQKERILNGAGVEQLASYRRTKQLKDEIN